ncbi:uncharacterized protein LOC110895114 [Helianthus annuus]|uniref:uncharacterized protein LOC110895114 n=1 Tax=Helianthus annuus TaxID=4232 RepID=UPI000B8F5E51|nr:uncharacterized protein LOC110895114 [Helianthus annuus]
MNWNCITRLLRYLRYTQEYVLHYNRYPVVIEGHCDANWISDKNDSRATSGYVFSLGGATISWKSSKQTVIARSTMESEFIALDKAGEEAEWLRMASQPMSTSVSAVMTAVMTSAVAVTTGLVAPLPNAISLAEKPEKFNGVNFKQWQQKMFFYLTTLNLARFLTETVPHVDEGDVDAQSLSAVHAWNHSDFLCRNYILNGLVDTLYNVYCKAKTAEELWESLDRKYKTEDAGTMKFVVAKFSDFKMIDAKTVMSQVQELQLILHDIHAEGMILSETFQVAAMIEKLPPSCVDFKNHLKHKRKEMTIEDLVVRLRIEEDNKLALKRIDGPETVKANLVEHG